MATLRQACRSQSGTRFAAARRCGQPAWPDAAIPAQPARIEQRALIEQDVRIDRPVPVVGGHPVPLQGGTPRIPTNRPWRRSTVRLFMPGSGGLVQYWRDVSLGHVDISKSRIFGWIEVDIPARAGGRLSRQQPARARAFGGWSTRRSARCCRRIRAGSTGRSARSRSTTRTGRATMCRPTSSLSGRRSGYPR